MIYILIYYDHQVVPVELAIVTEITISGNSEWICALLCNLNHNGEQGVLSNKSIRNGFILVRLT